MNDAMTLGDLRRGRVCYLLNGAKLKVVHVGIGSVTVALAGTTRTVKGRTFTPTKKQTLAPSTIVYRHKPDYTPEAPMSAEQWIATYIPRT
jgi:hypothetical protein